MDFLHANCSTRTSKSNRIEHHVLNETPHEKREQTNVQSLLCERERVQRRRLVQSVRRSPDGHNLARTLFAVGRFIAPELVASFATRRASLDAIQNGFFAEN